MNPAHWKDRKVLIVGDVMLDVTIKGTINRSATDCTTYPIVDQERREYSPGGAANVAAAVKHHGGTPILCGVVGIDFTGHCLTNALRSLDIAATNLMPDDTRRTTAKTRVMVGADQVLRIDDEDRTPIGPSVENKLAERIADGIETCDAVIISDYGKGVCTPSLCQTIIDLARKYGIPCLADPKGGDDWGKFAGCSVIKPNMAAATGRLGELMDLAPSVLVTRGPDGMMLLSRNQDPIHIPATPTVGFIAIGAGDRLAAIVGLGLASGAGVETAARAAARLVGGDSNGGNQ